MASLAEMRKCKNTKKQKSQNAKIRYTGVSGMVYFTSDLHFGHSGIIAMQDRPFSDVEEMNRVLLRNYNSYVHKNDTVYILGDICHHLPMDRANDLIGRMNGKKILIRGNHDKKYDEGLFEEITDFKTVSLNGTYFALMLSPHHPSLQHTHGFLNLLGRHPNLIFLNVFGCCL